MDRLTDADRAALEKLALAIDADPSWSTPHAKMAQILYRFDRAGARAEAERALVLEHDVAFDYYWLAVPFEHGQRAREILRLGMEWAEPGSFEYFHLWQELARCYFYVGDFASELRELQAMIELSRASTNPLAGMVAGQLRLSLGNAHAHLDQHAEAEAAFRSALELPRSPLLPGRDGLRNLLAVSIVRSRLHRGDFSEAARVAAEEDLPLTDGQREGYEVLVAALEGRSLDSTRLAQLDFSEVDLPDFCRGVVLHALGDTGEAEPLLRAFVARVDSNPREWGVTLRWERGEAARLLAP